MSGSPLDQFKLHKIVNLNIFGIDISLTNSSILMLVATVLTTSFLFLAMRKKELVPSRLQMSAEFIQKMIYDMVTSTIGPVQGKKFVPLIFSLFMFILLCNLFGMIPYSFTVTSHISVTFFLATVIFFTITLVGFSIHGLNFLSIFLPHGTPVWLAPLMIIIELFTFLSKPISLSLRLAANMGAGHILLKIITTLILSLTLFLKFLPIPIIMLLIGFEIFVAILQAYIFALLSCAYLNDAVNLH